MSEIQDNLRNIEQEALALVERFVARVIEKIRRDAVLIIERGGPSGSAIATGQLHKGIVTNILRDVAKIVGVVGVAMDVPYGIYRHEDTRPHWPPLKPLVKWVRLKRLAGTYSVKSRRRLGGKKKQGLEDMALARAIARKIARKGTKGLPFLRMALQQNQGWIEAEMARVSL